MYVIEHKIQRTHADLCILIVKRMRNAIIHKDDWKLAQTASQNLEASIL
jgi:hypothetical protein